MKKGTIPVLAVAAGLGYVSVILAKRRSVEQFTDKVVVITGSSRGLGLALAEQFGREGAFIVLTARDPFELDAARKQLLDLGAIPDEGRVLTIPCDLRDPVQANRMIQIATERFGRVDVLVNNAGVIVVGAVEDQSLNAFTDAIESNYYSALYPTLAVLPAMLGRGKGNIVNISSIGGKVSIPHLLPYSASKFALTGFSQGLRAELRPKGVRVTTVCPGLMRTGSHLHALFAGDREREYRWFSLSASFPGISTSAKSAARKIVRATHEGVAEISITPQAILASRLGQVAPGCTAGLLSWVNDRILPRPRYEPNKKPQPGSSVDGKELTILTSAGRSAAYRFNQRGSS